MLKDAQRYQVMPKDAEISFPSPLPLSGKSPSVHRGLFGARSGLLCPNVVTASWPNAKVALDDLQWSGLRPPFWSGPVVVISKTQVISSFSCFLSFSLAPLVH